MNQPSTQQTEAPAPTPDLNGRAAQLAEQIRSSSEPAGDAGESPSPKATEAPSLAAPADSEEARAQARRERLAALSAQDRERVDHKARLAAQDKLAKDLEAAQKRAEEAEARAASRIDRADIKDPMRVFAIMQEEGVAPDRIAEAIREAMANPEKYAEARATEAAKKAVDPEVKALREKLAALEAREAEREAAWQKHQEGIRAQQAASEFFKFTEDNATVAPYAASFLRKHGPEQFYKLADKAAQDVPAGAGYQAVLDIIEENLSALASTFGTPPTPSKASALPSRAAAKANTVSNKDAATRATVVDGDEDLSSLTLEERAERLTKRLAGSS